MIRRLYPNGKRRAFSLSYDDGVTQDARFIELLGKYGVKGTFNLNSGLMETGYTWVHECGMTIYRLSPSDARGLYTGHEVASHSLTHPYITELPEADVMRELKTDKDKLEQLFGREIRGFAVPFDRDSALVADCARRCGFSYTRIAAETMNYSPGFDGFLWKPGIFHLRPEFMPYVEGFLQTDEELAVCHIVGHTYDLDTEDMWDAMERAIRLAASCGDAVSMTTIELVDYLTAMGRVEMTESGISNPSGLQLWFDTPKGVIEVPANGKIDL